MNIAYRDVSLTDFDRCIEIRGQTRDNAVPEHVLTELGITFENWASAVKDKQIVGVVAEVQGEVVGFCSGQTTTGEILVLALIPDYEGLGVGKHMLSLVTEQLFSSGWESLWLAASPAPQIRAHGFYRYLGWQPTGEVDQIGDQLLRLLRK